MKLSATLFLYVARQYFIWLAVVFFGFAALLLIFDSVDLLRRAASRSHVSTGLVLEMAVMRLPGLAQLLFPFAVLFGAMFAFWRLTRSQELVVARSAGVSVWQFLAPALALTFIIGLFKITLFGPFAAALLGRFERLEAAHFSNRPSTSGLFPSGLGLRQTDGTGHAVLHAERVLADRATLENVVVFRFARGDRFVARIDAEAATLGSGRWELRRGQLTTPEDPLAGQAIAALATDLTWRQIEDSFAPPETLALWELPGFIQMLEAAGFSALRHRLHYHATLASPMLLCAMVLIAATFSLRPGRRGNGHLVAGGLATGFSLYIASDLIAALGLSGRLPVELAAWAPASICLLLGGTTLLHLEEA